MRQISKIELDNILENRSCVVNLQNCIFENMDLSDYDLQGLDFSHSDFRKVILKGANLQGASLHHTFFAEGCNLSNTVLKEVDMSGSIFRGCDLSGANIEGANLYCSNFEDADMSDIKANEKTQYYELRCPQEGAFIGYKRCFNETIVRLLIPADARRSSATANSCRCNKAKVLSIKTFDGQTSLDEAWSVVDEDFVYHVGEWVLVKDFNEDRWRDSTTGIHFWMTEEEACNYLG